MRTTEAGNVVSVEDEPVPQKLQACAHLGCTNKSTEKYCSDHGSRNAPTGWYPACWR